MTNKDPQNTSQSIPVWFEHLEIATVKEAVAELQALLDERCSEARLHEFLASHTYFFNSEFRLLGHSPVYSKVKLGCNYEVDFAWFDSGSFGAEWVLVEIEAPKARLYTKGGNPSAALTHAVQQVRDWHSWIHESLGYARKLMPGIEYPHCLIFIGRRSELDAETKAKLRRYLHDNRAIFRLHTLDWFAGAGDSVVQLLQQGHASLPSKALSHKDLASGLPEGGREWVEHQTSASLSSRLTEARRQDREDMVLRSTEFDN